MYTATTHFLPPPLYSLKAPLAPNGHQSSTQSCSQRQLNGDSSVTQVGGAAVPGDVIVNIQDGQSRLVFAGSSFYAASVIDRQYQIATKVWRKKDETWYTYVFRANSDIFGPSIFKPPKASTFNDSSVKHHILCERL